MALFRMIMKEAGGSFQNAAGTINSNKNMYAGAKGCAPSDKLAGGFGGISGGTGNISAGNLMGGAGGMSAGDASSGADFSSMGEAASAMA